MRLTNYRKEKREKDLTEIFSASCARSERVESLSLLLEYWAPPLCSFSKKSLTIVAKSSSLSWLKAPPPPLLPAARLAHGSPIGAITLQSIPTPTGPTPTKNLVYKNSLILEFFSFRKKFYLKILNFPKRKKKNQNPIDKVYLNFCYNNSFSKFCIFGPDKNLSGKKKKKGERKTEL